MKTEKIQKTEMRNPATKYIDRMSTKDMAACIQRENENAAAAVGEALPEIEKACDIIADRLGKGGKLIYIGAGTSGRLGVLDAVECPPTFGVPRDMVVGIIAGGYDCMFRAAEREEDNADMGTNDLIRNGITGKDAVVGISASGNAAYVVGALDYANQLGCATISITSNEGSALTRCVDVAIVADTGPEVIAGSTRMKAGTAQKMILNMLSTVAMVKLGNVYENLMINLQPANEKLAHRMIGIVREITGIDEASAKELLNDAEWNIRRAVETYQNK